MVSAILVIIIVFTALWGFYNKSEKITPYVLSLILGSFLAYLLFRPLTKLLISTFSLDYPSASIVSFSFIVIMGAILFYGAILILHKYREKEADRIFHSFSKINFITLPLLIVLPTILIIALLSTVYINIPGYKTFSNQLNNSVVVKPVKRLINSMGIDTASVREAFLSNEVESEEVIPIDFNSNEIYLDSTLEDKLYVMVNSFRKKNGLAELKYSDKLADVARNHSADMLKRRYFSHIDLDGKTPFNRISSAGINYNLAGENLAISNTLEKALEALVNSESHRANMLNPNFSITGIGIVRNENNVLSITQLFSN